MRGEVMAVYEDHRLVDTEPAVMRFLNLAVQDGRLVTHPETIRRGFVRLPDGRVSVPVTLRVPQPRRAHPMAHEVGAVLLKASAFVAVVGSLLIAVFYGLTWLADVAVAAVNGRAVMGVLGGLLVLWLWLSARRGHACKGIHCDGCGHR